MKLLCLILKKKYVHRNLKYFGKSCNNINEISKQRLLKLADFKKIFNKLLVKVQKVS